VDGARHQFRIRLDRRVDRDRCRVRADPDLMIPRPMVHRAGHRRLTR
jgi:hypothetical protein